MNEPLQEDEMIRNALDECADGAIDLPPAGLVYWKAELREAARS